MIAAAVAPLDSPLGVIDFDTFFAESCALVVGIVAATTGDRGLAEDATQEAFVRAFRDWERVRRLERPEAWVARVATRIAIDHWRRSRGPQEALDAGTAATHVPDLVTSFWVRWSLESLSPKQRAAFLLRHLEGRSVEEVASALGSSRETVKSHLKAAVRRLRSILVEDADG